MSEIKMPSEAEMLQSLFIPMVEEMGIDRTQAATKRAIPLITALGPADKENEQLALDTLRVVEHLCTTIRAYIADHEKKSDQSK